MLPCRELERVTVHVVLVQVVSMQERPRAPARTGGTQTEGKKDELEMEVEVRVL